MDASSIPPELIRELEVLRRRAYGLDADIDADPMALQRLDELEAALHPAARFSGVVSRVEVGSAERTATRQLMAERPTQETLVVESDELLDPVRHDSSQRVDRRQASPFTGTAVAVAAIIALGWAASALFTPRGDIVLAATQSTAQERQDLIDQVDLASFGMVGSRLQPFADFRELSVWSATSPSGVTCLLVRSDSDGVFQVGCTPAPLQPSIDLRVGDQVRSALVGDLAIDSVVRFVLRGDEVGVWIADAGGSTP
ncbi:hypothetical protein ASD65_04910 [Microbacterium sp. Root61]|uniref:hypothetical protein n=1 Tax=Microbacterium sp. Root61 TaxID=1736570 RepID=UPI0006F70B2A|nr:hypothetical protein [Microbacterium sp. Root61]KRA23835.1 hypothetical protein ASD65_04910 [Microbacterium sp. Root61]